MGIGVDLTYKNTLLYALSTKFMRLLCINPITIENYNFKYFWKFIQLYTQEDQIICLEKCSLRFNLLTEGKSKFVINF